MHLGTASLLQFYQAHRHDDSLVLATITATVGSTYRKPGAMMLISRDEQFEGLISGGCLEGDLLQHAAEVFASGIAKSITYDMHASDELVWGLGLGCDGIIRLLLQRLDRGAGFGLLDQLGASLRQRQPALVAVVVNSARDDLPVGLLGSLDRAGTAWGDETLIGLCRDQSAIGWPAWRQRSTQQDEFLAMLVNVPPQPRVLLCGAGPDAVPVARALVGLGWECVVVDHRPAYARAERFPDACSVLQGRPERLSQVVSPGSIDAAVIMSHHLENDAAYLQQLAQQFGGAALAYIGVLGPSARRDRLKDMAGAKDLVVHGPAGLDIGAELPEAIALSIVAEIHAVLNGRDGQSLTIKASQVSAASPTIALRGAAADSA